MDREGKDTRNIVITGLMGTGKSTVGAVLAAELNRQHIDTDQYIKTRYGNVADILDKPNGDSQFRLLEESVSLELSGMDSLVISTGGRMMVNQNNIDCLCTNGVVYCLVASLDTIVERLLLSSTDTYRPRFERAEDKLELMTLLRERSAPFFSQFQAIETDGFSAREVALRIAECYRSENTPSRRPG